LTLISHHDFGQLDWILVFLCGWIQELSVRWGADFRLRGALPSSLRYDAIAPLRRDGGQAASA